MAHWVTIDGKGERFACAEDVNVLAAMERTLCRAIPVGCRNGGCGACKVRITSGRYETRKMNRAVVSVEEEREGCVLACKTYPRSDIGVLVLGRAWRAVPPQPNASPGFGFARSAPTTLPDKET